MERVFTIPWFKHDRPDEIAKYANAIKKVVARAEELVELSLRAIRGEIKPVMHKFDCRMIEVRTLLAEIGGNLGLTLGGLGTGAAALAPADARLRRPSVQAHREAS